MVDYKLVGDTTLGATGEDVEFGSFAKYVAHIARQIPDVWDIQDFNKHEGGVLHLKYLEAPACPELVEFWKYFSYKRLKRDKVGAHTVEVEHAAIVAFLKEMFFYHPLTAFNDGYKSAFEDYVENLKERVRSKVVEAMGDNGIESRTARTYTSYILRFFAQISALYPQFSWVLGINLSKALPNELRAYFEDGELEELQRHFDELQFKNKTLALLYDEILDIDLALRSCPKGKHIFARATTLIGLHAGLRISEIRRLNIDCLVPLKKEEIEEAIAYREAMKLSPMNKENWKGFYWLRYESAKDRKSQKQWSKGTPILVSQDVADVIQEVIDATQELREESGSERIFLSKRYAGRVTATGSTSMAKLKNAFIDEYNLPYYKSHQLRATFASILYDMDVPIEMIQKYLNHLEVDVTGRYIGSELERKARAMQAAKKYGIGESLDKPQLKRFSDQLSEAFSCETWDELDLVSQIDVFDHVCEHNGLSVSYMDHGFCILLIGEDCWKKIGDVATCYASDCTDFRPARSAIGFFRELLERRDDDKVRYFEMVAKFDEETIADAKREQFDKESASIGSLIVELAREAMEEEREDGRT